MKKRNEQFTPDPAFNRPAALPDETKKSADDFARHLAALLRADKHAHEDEPPQQPQLPDLSDLSRDPDIPPARGETIPSAQAAPTPFTEDFWGPEDSRTDPEIPKIRSDLSDKPFAPPQEDPSLDEIFNYAPPEENEEPPVLFRFEDGPFAETGSPRKEDTIVFPQPEDELLIFPRSTEEPPAFRKPEGETLVFPKQEEMEAIAAKAEEVSASEPDLPEDFLRPEEAPQEASPAPLSRDTTGSLPSLEEIFGTAPEPAAPHREESPAEEAPEPKAAHVHPTQGPGRFARRSKLRGLLDNLLAPESPDEFAEEAAGEQAEAEARPERESAPQSEAIPEADALPNPERSSAPETLAEPAALPHPTHPEEKAAASDAVPSHPRKPSGSAGTGPALTLEELLAAAVPMEEAAPPKIAPPPQAENETPAARRRKRNRDHAARRSRNDVYAAAKAAAALRTEAAPAKTAAEIGAVIPEPPASEAAQTVPSAAVKSKAPQADQGAKASRPAQETESPRWAPSPRQREAAGEAASSADPVPSADVRKEAPAPKAPARNAAQPKRDIDVLPPEESSVLHPEEAYRLYAKPLDEIGSRLILSGLFTILSLFFTLYLGRHWTFLPEIFSGGTTVYIQLGLLGLIVLTNRKLFFRRLHTEQGFRPALLLGMAALFTAADCFPAAKELRSPFTVVVGALTMIFLWGEYDRGMALTTTVKVLRGNLATGVSEVPEIAKGSKGLVRTPPNADRFMEKLETRDLTDRVLRIYTPLAALVGIGLTLLISFGLKRDLAWTGALIFLGSVPAAGLLAFPRLFLLLSRRLAEADAALCGYHGAEVFGGEHSILIGDEDIFPSGSLTLNGFKVYSGNPDRIIAYAAAAARSSGSALDPVFDDLLVTHNGRHYTVDTFRFYDSGGIGASIQEDVVLMGSLDFMRRMGVHMDKGARVKQAVYLSLNGELAAVFAVRYTPPDNLRKGLASIAGNRHFKGILVTRTFLGTPGFLKAKFGIPTSAFLYPSTTERIRLSEAELKRAVAQGAILAKDSFSGFAQAAAGGRMLRSATLGAAILTVLNGISGLLLMGVLAALAALETATALNLLIYGAAWLVPAVLLTVWGKHF